MPSPMLFSLFINETAPSVEQQGMHGIQLLPGLVEIFLLLFADDIVLISDTPRGLQNQLDVFSLACKDLFLHVNTKQKSWCSGKRAFGANTKSGISMETILKLSMNILILGTHLPPK